MVATGVEEHAGAEARIPVVTKTNTNPKSMTFLNPPPPLNPGQLYLTPSELIWDTNKPLNQSGSTNLPERLETSRAE